MNITRNIVSYFISGYKAGLVKSGKTPEEVENLDYTTIEFSNEAKKFLRAYETGRFHEEGIANMYRELLKK